MRIVWVIGRGGMLGSALERVLRRSGASVFVPAEPFAWTDMPAFDMALRAATRRFLDLASTATSWEIHWAAGVGTMGSAASVMEPEHHGLSLLAELLVMQPAATLAKGGLVVASSAGAIYAGSTDSIIDESTVAVPTSAYARAKLMQEDVVRSLHARTPLCVGIARISTLYGVSQAADKTQGLLTHISRCITRNQTIKIFVPLDTIRDYISADDAARMVVRILPSCTRSNLLMKIVASERPTTIGEIIQLFRRIARRAPRIVTSASPTSSLYTRRMVFRSIVAPIRDREPESLLIGISSILAAERRRYMVGPQVTS